MVENDPVGVVDILGLVAELDRLARRSAGKSAAYQCQDSGERAGDRGDDADQDEGGEKAEAEGNH
jgi:hypothetical protein